MSTPTIKKPEDTNQIKKRLLLFAFISSLAVLVSAGATLTARAAIPNGVQSATAANAQASKEYENNPAALLAATAGRHQGERRMETFPDRPGRTTDPRIPAVEVRI